MRAGFSLICKFGLSGIFNAATSICRHPSPHTQSLHHHPSSIEHQSIRAPSSKNSTTCFASTHTMAQKAKKDRAKSNSSALNTLHIGSLTVNILFLLSHFLFRPRSLVTYGLLATPSLICEYVLEISGRPKYDAATGALKTSGEDLSNAGLTEYMFDVIWVTWACTVVVMLLGNWGWLLWAIVPAYGAYLGKGLLGMGRQKMAEMQGGDAGAGTGAAPQGNRRARRAA